MTTLLPPPLTAEFLQVARADHPDLTVPLDQFATHLDQLGVECATHTHAADLYLAFGCMTGSAAALRTFDTHLHPVVRRAARRVGDATLADEVAQRVASHLLVATATRPPAIGLYAGRGKLVSWIAVVATREAMRFLRASGREITTDGMRFDRLGTPDGDLELNHMKTRYRTAFGDAFQNALDSLTTRSRLMLRYHVVESLSIDVIAQVSEVHRATAARWIARARQQLLERTRAHLMRAEGLTASEYDSVTRLIRSQLDLSLQRRLGDAAD